MCVYWLLWPYYGRCVFDLPGAPIDFCITGTCSPLFHANFGCLLAIHSGVYNGIWYVSKSFFKFGISRCDWPYFKSMLCIRCLPVSVAEVFGDAQAKSSILSVFLSSRLRKVRMYLGGISPWCKVSFVKLFGIPICFCRVYYTYVRHNSNTMRPRLSGTANGVSLSELMGLDSKFIL